MGDFKKYRFIKSHNQAVCTQIKTNICIYKDKVKQDMKKKADIAFQEMETQMMGIIKNDPVMAEQLKNILTTAKERMLEDD